MRKIQSNEARQTWAKLLRKVENGESVTIRRSTTDVAVLVPIDDHGRAGPMIGRRSAETQLRAVVRYLAKRHRKGDGFFWGKISDACGTGSTHASEICTQLGVDPETGKAANAEA